MNKMLIERYLLIFKQHPLADQKRVLDIMMKHKYKYTLEAVMGMSRYYDEIDAKDERPNLQETVDRDQLDEVALDPGWSLLEEQGLSEFLEAGTTPDTVDRVEPANE